MVKAAHRSTTSGFPAAASELLEGHQADVRPAASGVKHKGWDLLETPNILWRPSTLLGPIEVPQAGLSFVLSNHLCLLTFMLDLDGSPMRSQRPEAMALSESPPPIPQQLLASLPAPGIRQTCERRFCKGSGEGATRLAAPQAAHPSRRA